MPREVARPLAELAARSGLRLQLKVQERKGQRRLRLYTFDAGASGARRLKPWLSHDPTRRVGDLVAALHGEVEESDLTDSFKGALLGAIIDDHSCDEGLFEPVTVMLSEVGALASRNRHAPTRFEPNEKLRNQALGQRRALAAETVCMRADCVATRAENARLTMELATETNRCV